MDKGKYTPLLKERSFWLVVGSPSHGRRLPRTGGRRPSRYLCEKPKECARSLLDIARLEVPTQEEVPHGVLTSRARGTTHEVVVEVSARRRVVVYPPSLGCVFLFLLLLPRRLRLLP